MKNITKTLAVGASMLPFLALASSGVNTSWITSVITAVGDIISAVIPLLIAIALLVFIWGVIKFISAQDDAARDDGKKKMIWGVVGLFVIISVWGIVALLGELVGVDSNATVDGTVLIPGGIN